MMIGLPGSGKNHYVKQYHPDVLHVSRDDLRAMMFLDGVYRPSIEPYIIETVRSICLTAVTNKMDIIINETFAKTLPRVAMVTFLKSIGYEVHGIFLNTSVETCIKRRIADNRGCNTWPDIINCMNSYFIHPTMNEGYNDLLIHNEGV